MADREKLKARFEDLKASMEVGLFGTVGMDEVEAVLELIRETEPRVLTLDEVRRDHNRVLWIECDESKTQSVGQYRGQVCWHDRHIGKWERFVIVGFANDYLHRESEKYGKTWRCWTARPTEEQRKAVKWYEEPEDPAGTKKGGENGKGENNDGTDQV